MILVPVLVLVLAAFLALLVVADILPSQDECRAGIVAPLG